MKKTLLDSGLTAAQVALEALEILSVSLAFDKDGRDWLEETRLRLKKEVEEENVPNQR